jgi:tripartite ATP-independent transporter DctM subunit
MSAVGQTAPVLSAWSRLARWDEALASLALALMVLIPLLEMALRPLLGQGIDNAPVLVQHLGLVMTMAGAVAARRGGHLTRLGNVLAPWSDGPLGVVVRHFSSASTAFWCGLLAWASWQLVQSERPVGATLAYGLPVWWVQAFLPAGFALLGVQLGRVQPHGRWGSWALGLVWCFLGVGVGAGLGESGSPGGWMVAWLMAMVLTGSPVFVVLGGLALYLFWQEGQPLASVALSHYQITVNPSLPALPLFTLAGLVFARTGAAARLGELFVAVFGQGLKGTVVAVALLCSCFTAFTGGSGVTLLALGGLLMPMLTRAGLPQKPSIGLVTSASALGVLLAPSVPLIMYAIVARVPIQTMFLAGVLPALLMVVCLLLIGGYLRGGKAPVAPLAEAAPARLRIWAALWRTKWEWSAPLLALGSLGSGLATPTESAALTAAFAIATQALAHRDLSWGQLRGSLADCAQIIGGVMLILGMALGLTNYLVDSGLPQAAVEWMQGVIPNKHMFLFALSGFLMLAGALMEIYAAIVFLVPLLLPMALSYGVDPVHFGILFLANMELGFLVPPAGMNLYFASAMFNQSIPTVARAVLPAAVAIFVGSLIIAWVPELALALPQALGQRQ